jgi:hypothetical protein
MPHPMLTLSGVIVRTAAGLLHRVEGVLLAIMNESWARTWTDLLSHVRVTPEENLTPQSKWVENRIG